MAPNCGSNGARVIFLLIAAVATATDHVASALSPGRLRTTNREYGRPHFPLRASRSRPSGHDEQANDDHSPDTTETVAVANNVHRRRAVVSLLAAPILALATPPPDADAATRDPKTGILLPSEGEIEASIPAAWDEGDNPLSSGDKSTFSRLDPSPDSIFYSEPRFVEHVDQQAVDSMTDYISDRALASGDSVLDLCSSWTSHIRQSPSLRLKRVAGLGMNARELDANPALTERTVLDLNARADVTLPYEDRSFDVILLQLSIDYLIHPLRVMKECSRVLKKGGRIAILFSNRLFLSKAIGLWTGSDDVDKAFAVGSYLHFCNGGFVDIRAEDLSTRKQKGKERVIVGDPLYVVTATKG